jgi:diguanylate cyclase (GGDEF)-like protein
MNWRRLLRGLLGAGRGASPPAFPPTFVDPATGLPTWREMNERLQAARSEGVRGALVMLDVDLFKAFNDKHGHRVGDELLAVIARRMRALLPASADFARLGGDEFLVLLRNIDPARAIQMMTRCLEGLREPVALRNGATEIVTLSAGVAGFDDHSPDEAMRSCDLALYAAKSRGRDRVVLFDDDTRQIIATRRELVSTVVELQERNRVLREEARTDALTGLRNRLALDEVLEIVVGGVDSRLPSAAVAFIDVDHFSHFNHVHGDTNGDEALRAVAAAIRSCARQADFVFRKGGEEFVVLLPDADREAAPIAAERIRAAVESMCLAHLCSVVAPVVTVTVGVACGAPGHTVRQLVSAAAEQAMAAKLNGHRNRVHAVWMGAAAEARNATDSMH